MSGLNSFLTAQSSTSTTSTGTSGSSSINPTSIVSGSPATSSTTPTTTASETNSNSSTFTPSVTLSSSVLSSATVPIASIPAQATGSPQSNASKSSDHNPPVGAVIGGTIGGLLAGLIFGMLLTFFWMRRNNNKRSRSNVPIAGSLNDRKAPDTSARQVSEAPPVAQNWLVHLPQPADDGSLRNKTKTLLHQIDLHVENYYTDVDVGSLTEAAQSSFHFYDTNLLPAPLAVMMTAARSKKAVIKHCLTYMIIKKVDASLPASDTLLPSEIASLPAVMAQSNMANERKIKIGNLLPQHSIQRRNPNKSVLAFNEAYSHWRILTAYLRPSTTPMTPGQDAAIVATADHFINTFSAWSASTNRPKQKENLTEIMRHAINVGVMLFSQPSLFEFRWAAQQAPKQTSQQGLRLATFETAPALLKLTDVNGKSLTRQQIMLEATESDPRA